MVINVFPDRSSITPRVSLGSIKLVLNLYSPEVDEVSVSRTVAARAFATGARRARAIGRSETGRSVEGS